MAAIQRIRKTIAATAVFFAIAVIGLRGTSLWLEYHANLERVEAISGDLARVVEEYAHRTFETSGLLADDIAAWVVAHGGTGALGDGRAAHDALVEAARRTSTADYAMIVGADAVPIAVSAVFPVDKVDFSDRAWWKAHAEQGLPRYIGEAIFSRITNEVLFTFTRPIIRPDGGFDGVVQIATRIDFFNQVPLSSDIGRDARVSLIGLEGEVIARTGLDAAAVGKSARDSRLFELLHLGPNGAFRATSPLDGVERVVSFRRLQDWPVIAVAALPVDNALGPWFTSLYWSVGVLTLMFMAVSGLTWLGVRLTWQEERVQRELQTANGALAAALAERELLFKEVHHRVKNNLQVIGSLLFMQGQRFDDPRVRAAFIDTQERLQSIGLVHETLYRSETIDRVRLSEYLGRLVEALATAHGAALRGIAVSIDAEPVEFPPEKAVPLALTLTEVLTNAFKHAFADGRGGSIAVSARLLDGDLRLEVRDTGPGMPADAAKGSLGLTIIRALARQIGARAWFETDNGTVFRLDIPFAPSSVPAD